MLKAIVLTTLLLGAVPTVWGQVQSDVPANPYSQTRVRAFTYDSIGALHTETVEPGLPQSCLQTTYTYVAPGLATNVQSQNCASATGHALTPTATKSLAYAGQSAVPLTVGGVARTVTVPAAAFVTTVTNSLNQQVLTTAIDPRFGTSISRTAVDGTVAGEDMDDFGRLVRVRKSDGTRVVMTYCLLSSADGNTTSSSPGCVAPNSNEVPGTATTFTQSELQDGSGNKIGPDTREYHDKFGNIVRVATESFDGPSQPAAVLGSVIVQDTVYSAYGKAVLTTKPYFLATHAGTTTGSNTIGAVLQSFDVLGRVVRTQSTDSAGSATVQFGASGALGYGAYGSALAATTTITYQGQKKTTQNDHGQLTVLELNANGGAARTTDASGAQVAYGYDAFNNLNQVVDSLQNTTTVTYNQRGKKVKAQEPDSGLSSYDYDAAGHMVWSQTATQLALNQSTTYQVDSLGRTVQRAEPEYTTAWYYDAYSNGSSGSCTNGAGKLCEVTTGVSTDVDKRYAYDSVGRLVGSRIDVQSSNTHVGFGTTYDGVTGRQASVTYPTGVVINTAYTSLGFPSALTLGSAVTVNPLPNANGVTAASATLTKGTQLWSATAMNAEGAPESEVLYNQVSTTRTFDPLTGQITGITAGSAGQTGAENMRYTWDSLGNMSGRVDADGAGTGQAVSETFSYGDSGTPSKDINRLTNYTVTGPFPALSRNVQLKYNALGQLLYKSDIGAYAYNASGAGSTQPHALQTLTGASTVQYHQDADGNVINASGGKYSVLTYASFNRLLTASGQGTAGAINYSWGYDDTHMRIKEVRTIAGSGGPSGTRTTLYFPADSQGGLFFEQENNAPVAPSASNPSLVSNRHYFGIAGRTLGALVTTGSLPSLAANQFAPAASDITANKLEFWHHDNLTSLVATTDHLGTVTARYAYDPFGARRYTSGDFDATGAVVADWNPANNYGTGRGFTSHEELDDIGLVNMNGRVYDSRIGLMAQPDPVTTSPLDTQGYNRYAYLSNNPLNDTDPSGFASAATTQDIQVTPMSPGDFQKVLINGGLPSLWDFADDSTSIPMLNTGMCMVGQMNLRVASTNVARPSVSAKAKKAVANADFSPFMDGLSNLRENNYGGTKDGTLRWMAGAFTNEVLTGLLQLDATVWDLGWGLLSEGTNNEISPGVPRSAVAQAVSSGELTPNQAAVSLVVSPAVQTVEIVGKALNGDLKNAVPMGLAMVVPYNRLGRLGNIGRAAAEAPKGYKVVYHGSIKGNTTLPLDAGRQYASRDIRASVDAVDNNFGKRVLPGTEPPDPTLLVAHIPDEAFAKLYEQTYHGMSPSIRPIPGGSTEVWLSTPEEIQLFNDSIVRVETFSGPRFSRSVMGMVFTGN